MTESDIQYFKDMLPNYSSIIFYSWAMGYDMDEIKKRVIPIEHHIEFDTLTKPSKRDRVAAEVNFIRLISGKYKHEFSKEKKQWILIDTEANAIAVTERKNRKPFDLTLTLSELTQIDPTNPHYFLEHLKYPLLVEPFIRMHFMNRKKGMTVRSIQTNNGLTFREARTIYDKYKYLL